MTKHLVALVWRLVLVQMVVVVGGWAIGTHDPNSTLYLDIQPHYPRLEVGDTLELNCTIKGLEAETRNASELLFYYRQKEFSSSDSYVTVVNSRMARFRYPNISMDDTQNGAGCSLGTVPLSDYTHSIVVARKPIKPTVNCTVFNWSKMECAWSPTADEQIDHTNGPTTNTTVEWTYTEDLHHYGYCHHGNESKCVWKEGLETAPFHMGKIYHIFIIVTSIHTNVSTGWLTFNSSKLVKPNPVTALKAVPQNSTTVTISWTPPTKLHGVKYFVGYRSEWDQLWTNVSIVNMTAVTLSSLVPHSQYTLRVYSRPESGQGFNSDVTQLTFTTLPAAPRSNPEVMAGGYHIHEDTDITKRRVTVFWKPIPLKAYYGENLTYELGYKEKSQGVEEGTSETRQLASTDFQASISISDARYEVTVTAKNAEGYCPSPPEVIEIGSQAELNDMAATEWYAQALNRSLVSVSVVAQTSVPRLTRRDTANTQTTVFWCKGNQRTKQCQEEMQWEVVDPQVSTLNVTLPEADTFHGYLFGVSSQSGLLASPIAWADIVYNINTKPCPPSNVRFSAHQSTKSLTVEWDVPDCADNTALILEYTLSYCETRDAVQCSDNLQYVRIPASQRNHVISNLKGDTKYLVWMTSHSHAGVSPSHSPYISKETTDTWLTPAMLALIVILPVVLIPIIFIAFIAIFCKCRKVKRSLHIDINRPNTVEGGFGNTASHRLLNPIVGYRSHYRRQTSGDSGTESLGLDDSMISFNGHGNGANPPISPVTIEDVIFEESDEDVSNTNQSNEREYERRNSERRPSDSDPSHVQSYQLSPNRESWKNFKAKPLYEDLDDEVFDPGPPSTSQSVNNLDKSCDYALVSPMGVLSHNVHHPDFGREQSPPEPSNREYINQPSGGVPHEESPEDNKMAKHKLLQMAKRKQTTSSNSLRDLNCNNNCENGYVSDEFLNVKKLDTGGDNPSLHSSGSIRKAQNNIPGGYIEQGTLASNPELETNVSCGDRDPRQVLSEPSSPKKAAVRDKDMQFDNAAYAPQIDSEKVPFPIPCPRNFDKISFPNNDLKTLKTEAAMEKSLSQPSIPTLPCRSGVAQHRPQPGPLSRLVNTASQPTSGYVSLPEVSNLPPSGTSTQDIRSSPSKGRNAPMPLNTGYVSQEEVFAKQSGIDGQLPLHGPKHSSIQPAYKGSPKRPLPREPTGNAASAINTAPSSDYIPLGGIVNKEPQHHGGEPTGSQEANTKPDQQPITGSNGVDGNETKARSMPGLIPEKDPLFGTAINGVMEESTDYLPQRELVGRDRSAPVTGVSGNSNSTNSTPVLNPGGGYVAYSDVVGNGSASALKSAGNNAENSSGGQWTDAQPSAMPNGDTSGSAINGSTVKPVAASAPVTNGYIALDELGKK